MLCTTREVNATTAYLNEEEHINSAQKQRFDGEEITGKDLILVVCHQVTPTQTGTTLGQCGNAMSFENSGDGFVAEAVAQFQQLPSILPLPQSFSFASWITKRSNAAAVLGRPPHARRRYVHLRAPTRDAI